MFKTNKIALFFLLISPYLDLKGQDNRHFSVGIVASPNIGGAFYTGEGKKYFQKITENEKLTFGYSFGVDFLYSFNDKFSAQTGILYSTRSVFTELDGEPKMFSEKYNSVDIPLRINYNLTSTRLSTLMGLGGSVNFLMKHIGHTNSKITSRIFGT